MTNHNPIVSDKIRITIAMVECIIIEFENTLLMSALSFFPNSKFRNLWVDLDMELFTESKQSNNTANNIINTIVFYSQSV